MTPPDCIRFTQTAVACESGNQSRTTVAGICRTNDKLATTNRETDRSLVPGGTYGMEGETFAAEARICDGRNENDNKAAKATDKHKAHQHTKRHTKKTHDHNQLSTNKSSIEEFFI